MYMYCTLYLKCCFTRKAGDQLTMNFINYDNIQGSMLSISNDPQT